VLLIANFRAKAREGGRNHEPLKVPDIKFLDINAK